SGMTGLCLRDCVATDSDFAHSALDPRIQSERIDLPYRDGLPFVRFLLTRLELRNARWMGDRRIGRIAVGEQDRIERQVMRPENLPVEDDRSMEEEARKRILSSICGGAVDLPKSFALVPRPVVEHRSKRDRRPRLASAWWLQIGELAHLPVRS